MPRARALAVFPGSFDPVTNGHLDVLRQACAVADRIVIAIGVHSSKAPVFPAGERAEMLEAVCGPLLQERGVLRAEYTEGATLREHMGLPPAGRLAAQRAAADAAASASSASTTRATASF